MTTLLLIRHAETDAVGKVLAGRKRGWSLNQTGRLQALWLADRLARLPLAAIYTSPLERAVETAIPLASRTQLVYSPSKELNECDFGSWEGLTFEELQGKPEWQRYNQIRSQSRPPNGESALEVQLRMMRKIREISQRHADSMVALVSHADPLRTVIACAVGISIDHVLRLELSPGSVSVLNLYGEDCSLRCLNQTEQLTL